MKEDLIIDGCAFTETEFTGVTEDVLHSKMDAFFLTIPGEGNGYVASTRSIGKIYNMLDNPKYGLMIAKSVADIYKAKEDRKKALILAFQNPNSIENSLEQLRVFYELGVRVIQMTYNDANFIGTGCCESQDGGLTDFGKRVLKMMNRLGMLADLSHVGKKTTMDIIRLSEKPVAVTHAGVYNITPSVRTKTDEEMLAIKENGGVMGISPWAPLIWKKEKGCRPDVKDYVDHVDYVVNLIGIDHVSFGADNTLDGNKDDKGTADQAVLYPAVVGAYNSCVGTRSDERHAKGFEGCWQLENVMDEMKRRGYSEEDIAKLTGKNLLRVLRANWN